MSLPGPTTSDYGGATSSRISCQHNLTVLPGRRSFWFISWTLPEASGMCKPLVDYEPEFLLLAWNVMVEFKTAVFCNLTGTHSEVTQSLFTRLSVVGEYEELIRQSDRWPYLLFTFLQPSKGQVFKVSNDSRPLPLLLLWCFVGRQRCSLALPVVLWKVPGWLHKQCFHSVTILSQITPGDVFLVIFLPSVQFHKQIWFWASSTQKLSFCFFVSHNEALFPFFMLRYS